MCLPLMELQNEDAAKRRGLSCAVARADARDTGERADASAALLCDLSAGTGRKAGKGVCDRMALDRFLA